MDAAVLHVCIYSMYVDHSSAIISWLLLGDQEICKQSRSIMLILVDLSKGEAFFTNVSIRQVDKRHPTRLAHSQLVYGQLLD